MARTVKQGLSGPEKAAALIISLGPDVSPQIFKHLGEEEIEELTLEIANTPQLDKGQSQEVLEEFYQLAMASEYLARGGADYARTLLESALGEEKAVQILARLTSTLQVRPFDAVRKSDPSQVLNFIQNEHPQTIALVLAHMNPGQAAQILSSLSQEMQAEVARRLAMMDRASPDIIREVDQVLERRLSSMALQEYTVAGGLGAVVEVLSQVDRGTEKTILESLDVQDPELAEEIRRRMFVFDDIVLIDDRSVQRVLRDIDLQDDLPLALKGASDEVTEKIKKNLSSRAAEMLEDNLQYLGPVRLRQVEEAQQKIVNMIRQLEDEGEIVVARGGGDEIIM